jgi:DNA replication protein DnaC
MLNQQTLDKLYAMKLSGMADALKMQMGAAEHARLSFEERLGLLIDAEGMAREQRRLTNRLRVARLRYAASVEDIDFKHPRGIDRQQVLSLAGCDFIERRHNLLISGPTGIGKSYLACAFVERACRRGYNAAYVRLPRLLQQIAVARGDGSYTRILDRMARLDLLAIDDWLLSPLRDSERRDLVEVVEDRSERASTLIASQLASKDWHASIGDPNLADSICDRLLHNAHRIDLKGPSMRRGKPDLQATAIARRKP